MNKHQNYDLVQMQSLPLEAKISMSKRRIQEWYDYYDGNVYVSRSGGKDSDVVGHLVKQLYPDVPHVFVNTGLELPSVRKHAVMECDKILKPEKTFSQIISEYGYPIISKEVANVVCGAKAGNTRYERLNGTLKNKNTGELSAYNCKKYKFLLNTPFLVSDKCCLYMKKKPAKKYQKENGQMPILGLMASESRKRKIAWMKTGCNAFESENPQSQPIAFWTDQDVLRYIKMYNLNIADAYGEVVINLGKQDHDIYELTTTKEKRTGCIFCCFGIANDPDRFIRLMEQEQKLCDYIMRAGKLDESGIWKPGKGGLGYWFLLEWLNVYGNMKINIPNRQYYISNYCTEEILEYLNGRR